MIQIGPSFLCSGGGGGGGGGCNNIMCWCSGGGGAGVVAILFCVGAVVEFGRDCIHPYKFGFPNQILRQYPFPQQVMMLSFIILCGQLWNIHR